jgi:hypothetical protein
MKDLRGCAWRMFMKIDTVLHVQQYRKIFSVAIPTVFPLVVILIGFGLWQALTRTKNVPVSGSGTTWLVIIVLLMLWLLGIVVLAYKGAYKARLTIPLSVLISPAIGLFLLTKLPHVRDILLATPVSWLVGLMAIRLIGGIFLVAWASGEVKKSLFNVTAGSLDIFIGVTALPVAWWLSTGSHTAVVAGIIWNVIGILDFVLALVIAAVSPGAGPIYMVSLDTPTISVLKPTIIGIVAFGVPLAIMVHILSLWQLLGR